MKLLEQLASIFSTHKTTLLVLKICKFIDSVIVKIKAVLSYIATYFSDTFSTGSTIVAIKFLMSIALLIFIRGGLPRYRFDHLTKVGWVKFLTLVVCFLLIELLFLYTFLS